MLFAMTIRAQNDAFLHLNQDALTGPLHGHSTSDGLFFIVGGVVKIQTDRV